MSFRSGITRAGLDHGTLSFPIISAPAPPAGPFNAGDVAFYAGDFGQVPPEVQEDINELLHSCREAWQELGIDPAAATARRLSSSGETTPCELNQLQHGLHFPASKTWGIEILPAIR